MAAAGTARIHIESVPSSICVWAGLSFTSLITHGAGRLEDLASGALQWHMLTWFSLLLAVKRKKKRGCTWDPRPFRSLGKKTGIVLNIAWGESEILRSGNLSELEAGGRGQEGQTGYLSYWFSKVETRRFRGAWLLKFPRSRSLLSRVAVNTHTRRKHLASEKCEWGLGALSCKAVLCCGMMCPNVCQRNHYSQC